MASRKFHLFIRRSHRYLGVIFGIQFLFWTLGGLYFSWSDINEIGGDFQRKHSPHLSVDFHFISPDSIFTRLSHKVDSIHSIQIIAIFQKPFYSISYYSERQLLTLLADAQTGKIRQPLNKNDAVQIATENFTGEPKLKVVEYITTTDGHHEYREKPLPAWAVTFDHPTNTTVYVSCDYGRVESFRNNKWRIYDFLWMMHIMDYKTRNNINNWVLRIFSAVGLLTVISGFTLFVVSSRYYRQLKRTQFP